MKAVEKKSMGEEEEKNDLGESSSSSDARSSEKPRTNEGNWFVLGHFHWVLLSRLHALIIMQLELNGKRFIVFWEVGYVSLFRDSRMSYTDI